MTEQPGGRQLGRPLVLADENRLAIDFGSAGVRLSSPQAVQWALGGLRRTAEAMDAAGLPLHPAFLDLLAVLQRHHDAEPAGEKAAHTRTNAADGIAASTRGPEGARSAREDMVTVDEAARLLGIKPRQVRYLCNDGDLPGRKRGGAWQIPLLAVTEAARERQEKTA